MYLFVHKEDHITLNHNDWIIQQKDLQNAITQIAKKTLNIKDGEYKSCKILKLDYHCSVCEQKTSPMHWKPLMIFFKKKRIGPLVYNW